MRRRREREAAETEYERIAQEFYDYWVDEEDDAAFALLEDAHPMIAAAAALAIFDGELVLADQYLFLDELNKRAK